MQQQRVYEMQILYKTLLGAAAVLLLNACNDKSIVTVYDKSVTKTPVKCLSLQSVPEDKKMREILLKRYPFKAGCPQRLSVSYKSGIVCNSAYNAPQKALSNFPNSYLNMEIRKGLSLQYSYYIDLDHKPDAADIEKGFEQIKDDLKFESQ